METNRFLYAYELLDERSFLVMRLLHFPWGKHAVRHDAVVRNLT